MTIQELHNAIKSKKTLPVYLLHGEESFFLDKAVKIFENNILSEAEKSFNLTVFYGKDSKAQDIIDTCRRYPMFSEKQVVIVKEANQLRELEKLEPYLEHIVPSTVLVLVYKQGRYDARRKVAKLINKHGVVFESKKLYDNELPGFVGQLLKEKKMKMDAKASQLLIDSIGNNLPALMNELEKLSINISEGTTILVEHIEEFVGISKDFNVFELQNALLVKDSKKAFHIIHYMQSNPKANPFILTMANIYSVYMRLYRFMHIKSPSQDELKTLTINYGNRTFFDKALKLYSIQEVERIFSLLLEYDLRSKGMNNGATDDTGLLTELVYKLCNDKVLLQVG